MSTEPDGPMGDAGDKTVPLHPPPGPQGPWFPQPGFPPMSQGWIPPSQPWAPPTTQPWAPPTSQSWSGPWGVPSYSQSAAPHVWSHPPTTTTTMTTNASGNVVPDEYTVDTLRRIYDNDDGRIEIQRVKVQRRPAAADIRGITYPGFDSVGGVSSPENMSLVSAESFPLNERRPPPRKHKKRKEGQVTQMQGQQPQQGPYPWYPHMSYMPYPYPYCFGYMWPPPPHPHAVGLGSPPMMFPVNSQCCPAGSEVESEERSSSRLDSLPTTLDSFSRLESLNFRQTPDSQLSESRASRRSVSPTAASQVTDSQVTDIGPSDSISVRGYKSEPSLDWALHNVGIHGPASSGAALDKEKNRTKIRSEEKHRETDSTSVAPVRPKRRNASHMSPEEVYSRTKKKAEFKNTSKETLSQGDSGSQVSNDLMYAIRKFERSVNDVASVDADGTVDEEKSVSKLLSESKDSKTPQTTPMTLSASKSDMKNLDKADHKIQPPSRRKRTLVRSGDSEADGRVSRTSTTSFLSLQPSNDDMPPIDTDSTDIPILASDFATGDETDSTLGGYKTSLVEEEIATAGGYKWIIQQPGETPQLVGLPSKGDAAREDERRNAWRTEVSLWRARLVVSLCRGRGLDRQDWATFHLLVRHPLTLDLKLSLLHAPRLCAANTKQGAAMVRIALLHLAQYGEMLLQAESSRQPGWKTIKVDPSLPWVPVKGSTEILHVLGYRAHEDGFLRFSRRKAPETSLIARLTLDLLVLAEELRLYITGGHQCPNNVSDLFSSSESKSSTPTSINVNEKPIKASDVKDNAIQNDGIKPVSPSCTFVSAHSTPSHTDEETETLHASVYQVKKDGIMEIRRSSSSEDEQTLRAHTDNQVQKETSKNESLSKESTPEPEIVDIQLPPDEAGPEISATTQELPEPPEPQSHPSSVPSSLDEKSQVTNTTSLPDLQSLSSSTTSKQNDNADTLRCCSATPTSARASKPKASSQKENTKDNPDDHIYEEIGDVKAQVEALRQASASTSSLPPPLPPKARASSGVEDDSGLSLTYPKMDWSITSQDGSLRGGSTGMRKKKRRAPMPPSFMPPNWTESNAVDENKENISNMQKSMSEKDVSQKADSGEPKAGDPKKFRSQQSLNPFYEDTNSETETNKNSTNFSPCVEERPPRKKKSLNPFYEERVVPSGYVGKNPFYEDVEIVKKTVLSDSSTADSIVQSLATGTHTKPFKPYDNIPVVRPKRKAPRPPPSPAPGPDSDSSKKYRSNIISNEKKEVLSQTTSNSTEMTLNSSTNDVLNKDETNVDTVTDKPLLIKAKDDTETENIISSSEGDGSLSVQAKTLSVPGTDTISASSTDAQASGSVAGASAAPSSFQGREQPDLETSTLSETTHISGVETAPVPASEALSNLGPENVFSPSEIIKSSPEGTVTDAVKDEPSGKETPKVTSDTEVEASTSTTTSTEKISISDSKIQTPSTATSSKIFEKQGTPASTSETASSPASFTLQPELVVRDTSTPSTQSTAVEGRLTASTVSKLNRDSSEAEVKPRLMLSKEPSLSLADDIPYIDNSDVTYYKSKGMGKKISNQRASLFLHEQTSLPFIDDTDVPPNRPPPPPPPPSPPPSPPPFPPPPTPPTSPTPPATNQPNSISESVSVTTSETNLSATNKPDTSSSSMTSTTSIPDTTVTITVSAATKSSVTAATNVSVTNSVTAANFSTTVVSAPPTSTVAAASSQSTPSTSVDFSPHVDAPIKEDVSLPAVTSVISTSISGVASAPDATSTVTFSSIAAVSSLPAATPEIKLRPSEQSVSESQYEIPEAPSTAVSTEAKKMNPPPRNLALKTREISPEAEDRYEIPEAPTTPQDSRNLNIPAEPPFTRLSPIKEASPYSQASESDRYEIPENLTNTSGPTRISRLEPPRASTLSKPVEGRKGVPSRLTDDKGSGDLTQVSSRSTDSSVIPPRPPRRRKSLRPPPRPPKAPLKGSGELLSTLSPIAEQERSFHSSVSLSSYSTITTQSSSASSSFAQSSIPSEPSTPVGNHPAHAEVDPSDSKKKSTLKSRLRKSWPLLLCECMYANCHPLDSTEHDSSLGNKKSG